MVPALNIRLLGEFSLDQAGTPLTGVSTPRLQSLLAYLLLHRDAPQSRAHLAFQFWSDSTEAQARSNLRTLLHRLRGALPEDAPYLDVDAQTVQWHPDAPASVDVISFEEALAQAEDAGDSAARHALEKAADLYQGDLLPSCYDDWILPHRERLRQAHLRALERLTRLLEDRRDYDAAIAHAQRILRLDPLHEAATRRLMHLYSLKGDRAGALRAYHTCATALQRELGVQPSPATQRAYEQLLHPASLADSRPQPQARLATGLTPLAGREEEWAQLQAAWRGTARGPRLILILGEAGIGKTRLVEELLHWAARQGIDHAYGRCYAAEGDLAYAPVTALLQARPLPPLDDLWLSEVARLLPEVLAERPDLPPPQPMTEAWQRQRLFQALARAVLGDRSTPEPLLLVLDDLQWCDRESLEWLHFLLRFDPSVPLLVVGTCRPEELDAVCPLTVALPTLHRDVRLRELELGPLDEAETAALAASLTDGMIEATESRRLYQETEGNPLFVVESLRAGQPTSTTLSDLTGSPLPPRVQAVLATRLAQLSAPARQLAEVAATIGRQFTFPVLQAAGDGDEEGLVRGLDELWRRRIVRERGADAYDFGHDKLREAAYTALSSARRRLLHRRVAQALESVHAHNLDPVSRQVAAHYRRAGMSDRAIPYYLQAGELARDICAQAEAIACFERGLSLLEAETPDASLASGRSKMDADSRMAARFHEGMGDVLAQLARANEALTAYGRALDLLDSSERIPRSRLHRKSGELWWPQGQYTEALDALAQAEAILGTPLDKPATGWTAAQVAWWLEWGHVLLRRGRILYNIAQLDEMEETLVRLARGVEQSALPMLRGGYLQGSFMAALRRERYIASDGTMDLVWAASRLISASGDPVRMAEMEVGVGWASLLRGDLDTAEEHLLITLALAERTGHPLNRALGLTWLSVVHCRRGDVEATREYALRGLQAATEAHLLENAGLVRGNLAWIAWREGDLAEAETQAHAALALWEESAFVYAFHWTALFPLLAVAMDREQIPEALDRARALLDPQQQKLPDPLEAALQASIQAGDNDTLETACQHLEHAIQIAQETGYL